MSRILLVAALLSCASITTGANALTQASSTSSAALHMQAMPAPASAPSEEAALQDVDALIEDAMKQFGVQGVSVALVKGEKVVLSKGYGVRDLTTRQPMTNDTIVPIFSISKQFTSFAAGLLVDQNKLTFDAPVKTYLPRFETSDSISTSMISLRDLLSHRSGLPELTFLERDTSLTRDDALQRLPYLKGLASPRSVHSYSNFGYGLASSAIEQAAGLPFEAFVTDRIFKPLGMTRSTYSYELAASDPNHLRPIVVQEGRTVSLPLPRQSNLNAAAGGIYSTSDDMAKWMRVQLSKGKYGDQELIKPATLAAIHRPAYAFGPGKLAPTLVSVGYALGWYNAVYRGYPIIRHGGYGPGVNTYEILLPELGLGVAVLTNHDLPPFAQGLAATLLDRLSGASSRNWLAESLNDQKAIQASLASAQKVQENSRVNGTRMSHKLDEYAGTFYHPGYGNVNVRSDGNHLNIEWAKYSTPLVHWHYDVFQTTTPDQSSVWAPGGSKAEIRFLTDFRGDISALEIGGLTGVSDVTFERQESAAGKN